MDIVFFVIAVVTIAILSLALVLMQFKGNKYRAKSPLLVIILVLVNLTIWWGIFMPSFYNSPGFGRRTAAAADVANFNTAIHLFRNDCGRYPTIEEGTGALIKRPANIPEKVWHGPYLDVPKPPMDPWGRPYIYECPGKHNPDSFDIYSMGWDGKGGDAAEGNWSRTKQWPSTEP